MIEVLQVLGVGTYAQDYVNERPEPNAQSTWNAHCDICGGDFVHKGYGGGVYNAWQGVCKKANGATCYSPQGYHIAVYDVMKLAPEWPDTQAADHVHAFEYYAWVRQVSGVWVRCPHLDVP